jgi:lysozyme
MKAAIGSAAISFVLFAQGCAPAPSATATTERTAMTEDAAMAAVPDEEATSIPTFGGVPIIPVSAALPEETSIETVEATVYRGPPSVFDTNQTALDIIKESETLQLKAYDLGGYWFIGYGHLMLEGEDDVITEEQADKFLEEDLAWCEGALERMLKTDVSRNEFSAVAAFCYNVGSGKTRGSSIVKKLNDDDRPGAANAFLLWNRMNGQVMKALAERRARERRLFLTPG